MRPKSVEELVEAIDEANRSKLRLLPVCMGSKVDLGPPAAYDEKLELSAMPKVVEVDDEEFVLRVSSCVPVAEVQEELGRRGKRLALDPPLFWRSSIGGVVATNFYGPMAYRYMTPRDQLLSVRAVAGFGKPVRFGAPVMKDVAGYNIKRVLAGSWGTLAVLTEVYLRVYALPEHVAVVATEPKSLSEIRRLLPMGAAERDGKLYLRYEGVRSEVEYRVAKSGRGDVYYGSEAEGLWRSVTEAEDLFASGELVKAVAPPAQMPKLEGRYLKYPLLGVAFVAGPPPPGAKTYRLKPPAKWDLQNADIMAKIKQIFDPNGVLSPGRMP